MNAASIVHHTLETVVFHVDCAAAIDKMSCVRVHRQSSALGRHGCHIRESYIFAQLADDAHVNAMSGRKWSSPPPRCSVSPSSQEQSASNTAIVASFSVHNFLYVSIYIHFFLQYPQLSLSLCRYNHLRTSLFYPLLLHLPVSILLFHTLVFLLRKYPNRLTC